MRQNDLAFEVRDYLKSHPNAAVVNLGCGLDSTGRVCDNGSCKIYNLDYPDVIAVRNELLPAGEREENIPCDLNDTAWFSQIDASGGAVFFASGVFYYFLTEQVKALVQRMADAFPGGVMVFDAANRTAVKMIAKHGSKARKSRTWARTSQSPTQSVRSARGTAVCRSPATAICWATMTFVTRPSVAFPFPRQGRRQSDENADREDRIRRQIMKILVYGAGVLGCNLARNLFRAGKDVTLLARGNWAEEIRKTACGSRISFRFAHRSAAFRW